MRDPVTLVDQLRRQWKGHRWDEDELPIIVLDDVELVSLPVEKPPRLRIAFHIGDPPHDRPGVWEASWEGSPLDLEPAAAAVGVWGAIVYVNLSLFKLELLGGRASRRPDPDIRLLQSA